MFTSDTEDLMYVATSTIYWAHQLTKTFALLRSLVDVHLCTDNIAEWHKALIQLCIPHLLG